MTIGAAYVQILLGEGNLDDVLDNFGGEYEMGPNKEIVQNCFPLSGLPLEKEDKSNIGGSMIMVINPPIVKACVLQTVDSSTQFL